MDDEYPKVGVVKVRWPIFLNFEILRNFLTGVARHFAFSWVDRPMPITRVIGESILRSKV